MGSRMILAAPLAALPFMPFPALAEGEAEGRTAEHRLESNERQQVSEALKAVEEAWEAVEAATADPVGGLPRKPLTRQSSTWKRRGMT